MKAILQCYLGLALVGLGFATPQGDIAAAVTGLQNRYATVRSITGSFRQTFRAPGIEQVESGVFWLIRPGLMRWEYRSPEEKLFVTDTHASYLYTPADRQVMVRPIGPSDLHGTPLEFLLGQGDLQTSFKPSWETTHAARFKETLLLHLEPRKPEAEYDFVVVECGSTTFDMRRILIHERTGNTSEFEFGDLETNVKVDRKQFEFKIPKGVEVVRLEEK
jgi:outer membrane lipoprotein carrier protein